MKILELLKNKNFIKKAFFIGIIIFITTFIELYWAMGEYADTLSSSDMLSSFFEDTLLFSMLAFILLTPLFLVISLLKNNILKISLGFIVLASFLFYVDYLTFVARESSWSTYLLQAELYYTMYTSLNPIIILATISVLIINYGKLLKEKIAPSKAVLFILCIPVFQACDSILKTEEHAPILTETSPLKTAVKNDNTPFSIPQNYEIQYSAKGDLNNDGLKDAAVIVRKKTDTLAPRKVLVYLQNPNKEYRLDKTSEVVIPKDEYIDYDFKTYTTEDIIIENGALGIRLYGIGPSGNLFCDYSYFGDDLILSYIETYNMGAGSHQSLTYDLFKGKLTKVDINTMDDDMASESQIFQLQIEKHPFENVSPDDVLMDALNKISKDESLKIKTIDSLLLGEDIDEINAYAKNIYKEGALVCIDIDIVQITYENVDELIVVNENPKIRTYVINEKTIIYTNDCKKVYPSELLEIKERLINNDTIILVGQSIDGNMMSLNFGCYG